MNSIVFLVNFVLFYLSMSSFCLQTLAEITLDDALEQFLLLKRKI